MCNGAESQDKLCRCLIADAGDAFDIVRRISLQSFEIRKELGAESEARFHSRLVIENRVVDALLQREYLHALVVHQLKRIHITRCNYDINLSVIPAKAGIQFVLFGDW